MEEFTAEFVKSLWTVNCNLAFIAVVLIAIFLVLLFIAIFLVLLFKDMGGKK